MKSFLLLLLIAPLLASAQLKLAKPFSSNMVLQRDQPIHFWGKGKPGEKLVLLFAGKSITVIIKPDSSWSVTLRKMKASVIPQKAIIKSGAETLTLDNILIGDIWLCIGQSNMQFSLREEMHYKTELKDTKQSSLRFYNPSFIGKGIFSQPFSDSMIQRLTIDQFYSDVSWQESDSLSAPGMTAIGYYFGKQMLQETGVPVGLIHLAIGGCPIETFISKSSLMQSPRFASKLEGNWLTNNQLPVWIRERGMQNVGGKTKVLSDEWGPAHGYKPGFAFEAGIQPIIPLPIKGVLWYQGESNAQELERVIEYGDLQELMMNDYRKQWHQPSLPFYWVQLSSIDTLNYKSQLWPVFRDEQRKLLSAGSNYGMAVCSDIGAKNNVHPTNKKWVAERLARWALFQLEKKAVLPSGPLPIAATYKNGKVLLQFQYTGSKLMTSDSLSLRGFSTDSEAAPVAIIEKDKVLISVKQKPVFITYAWKPFTDGNLVNKDMLPASTFKIYVR